MKIKHLYWLILSLLLAPTFISAQSHGWCGTVTDQATTDRLIRNRDMRHEVASSRSGAIVYVPIKFHLISKGDGTGRISEAKVLDQLCSLNEFYAPQDIQFFIKDGFNYIDNNTVFSDHETTAGQFQMDLNKASKAVNIYIVESIENNGVGTTLGYYIANKDWIVIRKGEVNGSSYTLYHEMAHFFSVSHPFNGWDFETYNPDTHGNPVNLSGNWAPGNSLAPPFAQVKIEFVDGSNCETSGDYLCDTPPSYNFFPWSNCNYNGGAADPNGDEVNPDEFNVMDYFPNSCAPQYFTSDQQGVILADITNRTTLGTLASTEDIYGPEISTASALIEPANGSPTPGDAIAFDWEGVNGATAYLLEIDRGVNFNIAPKILVVYGTYKVVDDADYFIPGNTYYWRVTPFNSYYGCADVSEKWTFMPNNTVAVKNETDFVNAWNVQPNPVKAGETLLLEMDTKQDFEAIVGIYSLTGQLLQSVNHRFSVGSSTLAIDSDDFDSGLYLITIQTADAILNKKVVIYN